MYASHDGVTVWRDGLCAVPTWQLPAAARIVVVGEDGPFCRVQLSDGAQGFVAKTGLRA
jgi:hypothetical protein